MAEKEKASIFSWLFYFIILPFTFTLIITVVLMQFMGYDFKQTVLKATNKIPVVASIIPDPAIEDIDELKALLKEKDEKIMQKELALSENNKLMADMEREQEALRTEKEDIAKQLAQKQLTEAERLAKLKEIAKLYEGMSAKDAAKVLEQMTIEQVALILAQMSSKGKKEIFGKFSAPFSANLTNYYLDNIDYKTISVPLPMLTLMFESVEMESAVKIFASMTEDDDAFQIAVLYLERLETDKRKAYLKAMSTETKKTYENALED
jgi:flagellar motility protein MotE (MotC chaperone)